MPDRKYGLGEWVITAILLGWIVEIVYEIFKYLSK